MHDAEPRTTVLDRVRQNPGRTFKQGTIHPAARAPHPGLTVSDVLLRHQALECLPVHALGLYVDGFQQIVRCTESPTYLARLACHAVRVRLALTCAWQPLAVSAEETLCMAVQHCSPPRATRTEEPGAHSAEVTGRVVEWDALFDRPPLHIILRANPIAQDHRGRLDGEILSLIHI